VILLAFDGSPGNTIKAKFWSLHCFRLDLKCLAEASLVAIDFEKLSSLRCMSMDVGGIVTLEKI
jgi:hypothetical protein